MSTRNNRNICISGFLLLFKPGCISAMPQLSAADSLINIGRTAFIVYMLASVIRRHGKIRPDRLTASAALLSAYMIWQVMSTVINGVPVTDKGVIANCFGIILFSYIALNEDRSSFIKSGADVLGSYVIINTATVFLFPNGMYRTSMYSENYFLSYRTAWFAVYLMAAVFSLLAAGSENTKRNRRWAGAVIICVFISMIRVWTVTGIVCMTIGGVFLLAWKKRDSVGPEPAAVVIAEAAVFYGIVIRRVQEHFGYFFTYVIGKDITFTGRTRVWDRAFIYIARSPVIGLGRISPEKARQLLHYGVSHPHCMYLYIMMFYGLIGMAIYAAALFASFGGKNKDRDRTSERIVTAALITTMTAAQVESFSATEAYLFPLFLTAAELHSRRKDRRDDNDRTGNPIQDRQFRYKIAGVRHAELFGQELHRQ